MADPWKLLHCVIRRQLCNYWNPEYTQWCNQILPVLTTIVQVCPADLSLHADGSMGYDRSVVQIYCQQGIRANVVMLVKMQMFPCQLPTSSSANSVVLSKISNWM